MRPFVSQRVPLTAWRGDVTTFRWAMDTLPHESKVCIEWPILCDLLAPPTGPTLEPRKNALMYIVPCRLSDTEPYVGKTKEAMAKLGREIGPQRSAAHVTTATWIIFDFDGLRFDQVKAVLGRLIREGIAFLAFTTHSHGSAEKRGARIRVVLPVDVALDARGYREAHIAINRAFFESLADGSGKALCQQQSVWGCHPDRRPSASRRREHGGVLDVQALLANQGGQPAAPAEPSSLSSPRTSPHLHLVPAQRADLPTPARMEAAMPFIEASDYSAWSSGIVAMKALESHFGSSRARALAVRFAATSPEGSTRALLAASDERYDAGVFFDRATPTMTAEAAAGWLMARARDNAARIAETQRGRDHATEDGKRAVAYLAEFHPKTWQTMKRGAA